MGKRHYVERRSAVTSAIAIIVWRRKVLTGVQLRAHFKAQHFFCCVPLTNENETKGKFLVRLQELIMSKGRERKDESN